METDAVRETPDFALDSCGRFYYINAHINVPLSFNKFNGF